MALRKWLQGLFGGDEDEGAPPPLNPPPPVRDEPAGDGHAGGGRAGEHPAGDGHPTNEPRGSSGAEGTFASLDAGRFRPLSDDELRAGARGLSSFTWSGERRDRIPSRRDRRTRLVEGALVARGLLSSEDLERMHQTGEAMDRIRPAVERALDEARRRTAAKFRDLDAARAKVREERKREAAAREAERQAAIAERRRTDIVFLGREVSAWLADRHSDVAELKRRGLPELATPADVARALDRTISELCWLAFHSEATRTVHYVSFTIPKKSGGTRQLSAPHVKLAAAQEWILRNVLDRLPAHDCAHGFIAGRSILTNARPHASRDVVANLDLSDFFPSIDFRRVRGAFRMLGYSGAVATIFALLCTEAPRRKVQLDGEILHAAVGPRCLPQGACTSPALSNLVSRRLDARLSGIAKKLGWRYTRYADDMTFSAAALAASETTGYLLARVRHIAEDEGFRVNEAKTRVQRRNRAQEVTGLVVNDTPAVPRKIRRRLRAILHAARKTGLEAQNRDEHPYFEAWVRGMIEFVAMSDPSLGEKLRTELARLRP